MRKKFTFLTAAFVLLAFLAVPLGMRGQTRDVETFTFSELGYGNAEAVTTVEGTNVTLTFDQGTNATNAPVYYTNGAGVRMYNGNTLEVALNDQEGETRITAINFTFSGTYTGSLQNWTGSETSVSFTNTASGQARIQVIEVTYSEGGVAPITYTVTYNANVTGVTPIVDTYNEGANVTLRPANTFTNEGYTFSEWNTQADGDGDPYDADDVIENIQANLVLYAIWIEDTPSDAQWVLTNLADLTETDVFVIVGNNGSNYAMSNNNGTGSAPNAVAVTVDNDLITSNVTSTIQWTLSGNATDGYTFYPNGSTTTWLYCTNTNNGVRVGTNANKTFVVDEGYLKHSGTDRYVGIYNSQDWRCYTSTGGNIANQTFAFYKKVSGGVLPPSITANNVSIDYNATSGAIAYTINNAVQGGVLSATTESDWLTIGTVGATVPFTCTVNSASTVRESVVTLTYTYNRQTVTKNVIVTQDGFTMTIAEVRAQGTGEVVTQGTVTSITGSSNKTAYIQDATAAVVVYGDFTAAVGDEIRVSGTLSDYNGLLEIASPTVTVISSGNTINPELMTIAEVVASTNQGWYIRVENAMVTNITGSGSSQNTTVAQGDNTIVVRGTLGTTVAVNNVISLDGNIGYYNGNQIANPQNVDVQQVLVPSITITPATVNFAATGTNGIQMDSLTIVYENIVVTNYQSFTVQFYDEQGNETETSTWLIAGVTGTNEEGYVVRCFVGDNNGEARTAYFKVSALDAENNNEVYSNLVTVNQAEYVAPTYATLPFEFDGGKAAIDTIDGLYQEGLGTDYNNSPKLRFDHTGDWLLLQFQEMPGTLTFDIKGNSFSDGIFKVQTSEDGMTYTDLATYTELGATQTEEFDDLGENVRYIKWVYTEKVNGNVAFGNIHLYEFGGGPVIETYDLTVEPFENLEIFTFVDDELSEPMEGAGTIQVAEGKNVMLSVSANEGYEIQSLMVDGAEHVNDIAEDLTYTFVMPNHNVTVNASAVAVIPFEPATYTLATTIESGKTYIIVGKKTIDDEENYFAMGEQKTNNRGGVAISVDGTTATVDSVGVYEFVITALDEGGFYSIYDDREHGYLYAASSSANHLKTESELDEDGNGDWAISIDEEGMFSIVASNSGNRNVMQFNYNGGNTLFSCYSSASQSPVYLYVKDETPSVVTQTIALTAGWNWFSTNVEITLADLQAALATAGNGTIIKAKNNQSTTLTGTTWRGNLRTMDVAQMYAIKVSGDCEIQLEGMPINPADHPITIGNGVNWIGFPFSEQMTPTNAFAGFAVSGDVIKNKDNQSASYTGTWRGNLRQLVPGQGYIYKSAATEDRTLVFPTPSKAAPKSVKPMTVGNAAVQKTVPTLDIDIDRK